MQNGDAGKLVQITVIQIDNYGPWTNTLGDDREHKLQILQASLYSALQKSFAERDGLVFFNRFDEMLAVTNGISEGEHQDILEEISKKFPVTVSMGIGVGETPFEAQLKASKLLQEKGSAQSENRCGVIACKKTVDLAHSRVQVMHLDIDRITKVFTDRASAYETSLGVMSVYVDLMRMFKDHDALMFFLGGDNFMGLANGITTQELEPLLERILLQTDNNIRLKCGIGIAKSGRKAAELATMNLDLIRQTDRNKMIMSTQSL